MYQSCFRKTNPSKIVIIGSSAGGHLALMTGLLGNNGLFDTNCKYNGQIKVAAIIDIICPTDLTLLKECTSVKKWLGDRYENEKIVQSISPLYHVNKNSPPTLIIHGFKDPLVPYQQSQLLYKKLKANMVTSKLTPVEEGEHGKFSKADNEMINNEIHAFLIDLGLMK